MSPLGGLARLLETGRVSETAGLVGATGVLGSPLILSPLPCILSLRPVELLAGSSLGVGAAMDEREVRKAAVLGNRLLETAPPMAISALVLLTAGGPSRLFGL